MYFRNSMGAIKFSVVNSPKTGLPRSDQDAHRIADSVGTHRVIGETELDVYGLLPWRHMARSHILAGASYSVSRD